MFKQTDKKKSLILALIVICILVTASILLYLQYSGSEAGTTAQIYQDGELIREVDLTHVDAPYSFTVTTKDGNHNTIQVESGAIGIIDASCPDKVCQHTGMVSSTLYPISCLPNKLVIQLISDSTAAATEPLDGVTR